MSFNPYDSGLKRFCRTAFTLAACALTAASVAGLANRSSPTAVLDRLAAWAGIGSAPLGAVREWLADDRADTVSTAAELAVLSCLLIGHLGRKETEPHGLWVPAALLAVCVVAEAGGPARLVTIAIVAAVASLLAGILDRDLGRAGRTLLLPLLYAVLYAPTVAWNLLGPRHRTEGTVRSLL